MNTQQEPLIRQLSSINTINNTINLIQNVLLTAGILGTIIGAITSMVYLIKINQTSILPNIFSNTTNLLAIIFAFGFLWLTLLLICIAPYFLAAIWLHKKIEANKAGKFIFIGLFLTPAILTIIQILIFIYSNEYRNYIKYTIISITFLPNIIFLTLFYLGKRKDKKSHSKFNSDFYGPTLITPIMLVLLVLIFSFIILGSWILPTSNNEYTLWGFLITTYIFSFIINPLLSSWLANATNPNIKDKPYIPIILISSTICFMMYMVTAFFTPNFSGRILRMLHFVEFPTDSSWYLINNNFQKADGLQEISGIKKQDLDKIKTNFVDLATIEPIIKQKKRTIAMGKFCRNELPLDKTDCSKTMGNYYIYINMRNSILPPPQSRSNALYGYMAWNLGDIKVFCPQHIEFTDDKKKNEQPAKQCLLIDGKYLQILDDQYITSD